MLGQLWKNLNTDEQRFFQQRYEAFNEEAKKQSASKERATKLPRGGGYGKWLNASIFGRWNYARFAGELSRR